MLPLLLATLACSPTEETPLFAPATQELVLPEKGTMQDVIDSYAKATGQTLVYSGETSHRLSKTQVVAIESVVAHTGEVQRVTEELAEYHGFLLVPLTYEEPRLVQVVSTEHGGFRAYAIHVGAGQLDQVAKHTAVMFSTTITLPNSDVREVASTLRGELDDRELEYVIAAGNTQSLVLVGSGAFLAEKVRALQSIDAGATVASREVTEPSLDPLGFPEAKSGISIRPGDTLHSVMEAYGKASKLEIMIGAEERIYAKEVYLGITGKLDIPADRLHETMAALVQALDWNLIPWTSEAPWMVQLTGHNGRRNGAMRVPLAAEDIEAAAEYPAFVFTTLVELEHVDVRQLSNSMRSLLSDGTQAILPAGISNTMVVQAPGRQLVQLVSLMRSINAAADPNRK